MTGLPCDWGGCSQHRVDKNPCIIIPCVLNEHAAREVRRKCEVVDGGVRLCEDHQWRVRTLLDTPSRIEETRI